MGRSSGGMGWIRRGARFGVVRFLCAVLLTVLVGCGLVTSRDDRAVVEFWTMQLQPQYTEYFDRLIAKFETDNPKVRIEWVDVPWSGMESKILTAVAAKTAPDVVNLNPGFASQLASKGAWLDLSDRIPQDQQQQYLPKIWNASAIDGRTFGIPWYLTTRITLFNQELWKKAGFDTPPGDFQGLVAAARQMKEKTGKFAFFTTIVPMDSGEILESMVQRGISLVDRTKQATFDTPLGRQFFSEWVTLYKDGLIPKEVLTEGHRYGLDLYQRGETAIVSTSPDFLKTLAKNAPTIAANTIAMPQITAETGKRNVAVMNLVIPKDTDQPDAALKFALFVANNENQLAFAKAANVLPSTQAALNDPHFSQLPENPAAIDRARLVSARQLESAEVLVPAMKDLKRLQKTIYEQLQSAMLGQKEIDRAIQEATRIWNEGG
jgi:putative chitobiose transport system substrate-binding protein